VKASRGLTIERMVELGRVSRCGFYRFGENAEPGLDPHMDLRDDIQRIALEWPCYGRPRITAELRHQGWRVNPKLVYRLMREDNLLCIRKRKFVVTTDSNHTRRIYPNLAEGLILTALRMALSRRAVQAGLVHHSDRGSQYASNDYTDLLKTNGIDISMSRKGNPWDNAACESFMKTLKYEEVHRNEYRDLAEARASIAEFLEKVYNQKRLHSALGYLPPAEFEAQHHKDAASRQLSV
jgi:putative transposase